jgi:hypothetical protein
MMKKSLVRYALIVAPCLVVFWLAMQINSGKKPVLASPDVYRSPEASSAENVRDSEVPAWDGQFSIGGLDRSQETSAQGVFDKFWKSLNVEKERHGLSEPSSEIEILWQEHNAEGGPLSKTNSGIRRIK